MEQVKNFRYLGVIITEDGRCNVEIKTRIGMAKDESENGQKIENENY